ncbi:porin [Bradyrhizobium sp. CCBAU 11361]|uniref:porin n=1 Tax=Bradyrhizobium sp. CCBAU 11361 TaxID=1630812 RepID=UPI00230476E3|nr:porin [Bradyrhizobium sp. CCBAU 11361]MDA9488303.1 polymerase [Bradyrhizobium sp. CCBAU 11361]
MKPTKTLIVCSVAMFATAGAQAADLSVKAKAVEYVKICSLYGAGFYYIPGTDTCIRLSGYTRAWLGIATNSLAVPADSGLGGAHNRLSNYYTSRARQSLNIDTRTATEYGLVRTYAQLVFSWTSGGTTGLPGGGTVNSTTGPTLGVYDAFIQFAGFTFGRAQSQFSAPWADYPGNWYELQGSGGWERVNQVSYTADFGQGITASLSAQDQVQSYQANIWNVSGATAAGLSTGNYGASDFGGSRAPDLVAMVRVDQAWGLFQASVAAHDNHAAYYGATEVTGHPADKWGWAGQLALSIKNIPTGPGDTINMAGVYTKGASRYSVNSFMNTTFANYGGTSVAGAYQSIGLAGLSDSVFVAGAGQELTTTYGFNGGYTHNWDPRWATALYGGLVAVRHNDTAKAYICGAFVAGLALSSGLAGCNPDFNYATVGTYTSWTPVKGLTFLAEVNYTMLDQKYASGSTVTMPAQAAIAKPAGFYELKNQNSLTMLLHAQRNW